MQTATCEEAALTCEPEDGSRANFRNVKYIKYAPDNGQCLQHKEFSFATVTEHEICMYEDAEQVNGMAVTLKFS